MTCPQPIQQRHKLIERWVAKVEVGLEQVQVTQAIFRLSRQWRPPPARRRTWGEAPTGGVVDRRSADMAAQLTGLGGTEAELVDHVRSRAMPGRRAVTRSQAAGVAYM